MQPEPEKKVGAHDRNLQETRGRDLRRFWQVASFVAVVGVVGGGVILLPALKAIDQPIAFNHRLHVEDLGADCTDCHLYAVTGARATIPNIEVCSDCHAEAQTESAAEARLVEYIAGGEKIPWRKIYWVPEHVYFSHRRHTAIAGLECDQCHGPVSAREEPLTRRLVGLSMDGCMECHQHSGVSNDCLLCHI